MRATTRTGSSRHTALLPLTPAYLPSHASHLCALLLYCQAFQSLDTDKKGYLEAEYFKNLMSRPVPASPPPPPLLLLCICSHGEKFSQEELEEMLAAAVDVETGRIYYEDFAELLADS